MNSNELILIGNDLFSALPESCRFTPRACADRIDSPLVLASLPDENAAAGVNGERREHSVVHARGQVRNEIISKALDPNRLCLVPSHGGTRSDAARLNVFMIHAAPAAVPRWPEVV